MSLKFLQAELQIIETANESLQKLLSKAHRLPDMIPIELVREERNRAWSAAERLSSESDLRDAGHWVAIGKF